MNTINLAWTANPADEQVSGYQVHQTFNGGSSQFVTTVSGTSYSVANAAAGVYTFALRAVNIAGIGPFSAYAVGPGLPSAPTPPTITVVVS